MSLLALVLLFVPGFSGRAQTASPYVPAVVVSSVGAVAVPTPPLMTNQKTYGTGEGAVSPLYSPYTVALDACGNIYTLDKGSDNGKNGGTGDTVTEVPANGGYPTILENFGGYENIGVSQNPTHANIMVGHQYSGGSSLGLIPLTNCVPNASNELRTGGSTLCYYNILAAAGDFQGDYYIGTNQTACVTNQYYLIEETGGNGNLILTNTDLPAFKDKYAYAPIAVDSNRNVYFIQASAGPFVFELQYAPSSKGDYAAAPVQFTGTTPTGAPYMTPVGLSVDSASNLYIVDQGNDAIYEIPCEANASGGCTLNPADEFTVNAGLSPVPNVSVAVSARGDLYYTDQNETAITKLSLGNANFGLVPIGQTGKVTLNFQFNAAVTPASVQLPTGAFSTEPGGNGFVQCTANTMYEPNPPAVPMGTKQTVFNYCQVIVGFTPSSVGKQSGSVVLADAKGNSIATAYLEGVGQGPILTLDPGTAQPTGSGLKSPTGVAVDQLGNTYIADSVSNSVTEYPAGGGAAVPLTVSVVTPACGNTGASSALGLAGPNAVAVDGPGNVYIADTGNNRIIKIPVISGALSLTSATTVGSCYNGANAFSSPASVFVQTNGDLYVTDTGNNRVVWLPNVGTGYGSPLEVATGLSAPLAMTADAAGDIFIANSGVNTIIEVPLGGTTELVDAGVLNASSMATDASGALFVVDQGNFRVLRIPSTNGSLSVNDAAEVAFGVANPYGIALDSTGNLYVTDTKDAAAYVINRSQVTVPFGEIMEGSSSDPLPLTIESAGTLPLVFTTPYENITGNAGDFVLSSATGACADAAMLAPGSSCDLSATFVPTATGARTATLTFNSNAANVTQALLSGTGMSLATTKTALSFTFAPGVNAPFYGEPLSFAATVTGSSPTGSVSFVVDGVQVGLLPLVSGVATLPLNSGLTGGNHSIYAVYKGDSANDGSSSAILPITIARAPTASTVAITQVPYNNPYSLRHSNKGSCSIMDALGEDNAFNAVPNDGVAFMGSVSSPGIGIPSGTFTWYSDGHLINGPISASNTTTSISPVLPAAGNTFQGSISSNADTLGDGNLLGENNTYLGLHLITVVYSGDQNYLPSTSAGFQVIVVDVGPTTPIILPEQPVNPSPYCDGNSTIKTSAPADPSSFMVQASDPTVTATASQPGSVVLTFSSLGGYNGSIDVACPDLPQYTTCSTTPGQVTVYSSNPGTVILPTQVTLKFTTNVPPYVPTANQSRFYWLPSLALGLLLLFSRRRFRQLKGNLAILGIALLVFGGMLGFSGCGSSSSSSSSAMTKPGTYPVTVVLTGSQTSNGADFTQYNEVFRPDVPYSLPLTLTVK